MIPGVSFLITILSDGELLRVALKTDATLLTDDIVFHPMREPNKQMLVSFLPEHIREMGSIVEIHHILDVIVIKRRD